jgi:hypothetical protein
LLLGCALPATARTKDKVSYGEGLIVNIPLPEAEVEQVVQDVVQNGIIRGTKEYNKDQFVAGAIADTSSKVFPEWTEGGRVFYKVRMHAIDPVNFKDSSDVGTLVVRYVVQPQGDKNTLLRIDALYEEDFRHVTHASNGSVESNEYKDIHEHIDSIELMKRQNLEAENARREKIAQKAAAGASAPAVPSSSSRSTQPTENVEADGVNTATAVPASPMREELSSTLETGAPPPAEDSAVGQAVVGPTLEQRLADLRKQVQRRVKAPGAPLKSAPFHTAITLQLMTPGTEVLIVIATTYWYGVETHDGLHGWMQRDQLEVP